MGKSSEYAGTSSAFDDPSPPNLTYRDIFLRFLRFGMLAWGGPFAQIAMIRRELVDEERWISSSRFNRLLAVYQVLPGPEAHELCVHLGMLAAGRLGGFMAGLGFMLPGFLLMLTLSWIYAQAGFGLAAVQPMIIGVQIAVVAMIIRAVHRIGAHVLTDRWLWVVGLGSFIASLLGVSFWITLPAAGLTYLLFKEDRPVCGAIVTIIAWIAAYLLNGDITLHSSLGMSARSLAEPSLIGIFLSGLKAGLLTFGGAYTAIPFVRNDAVGQGWMTDAQFLDGLALSGLLPAPLIIFSTFVGYIAGGPVGAVAMTAGIFLPAFGFTLLFHNKLEQVIQHKPLYRLLEGVSAGVVGMVVATAIELSRAVVEGVPNVMTGLLIFVLALALLYLSKSKASVAYAVVGSGLFGLLAFSR